MSSLAEVFIDVDSKDSEGGLWLDCMGSDLDAARQVFAWVSSATCEVDKMIFLGGEAGSVSLSPREVFVMSCF